MKKLIATLLVITLIALTSISAFAFPSMHITAETHPFEMPRTTWHDGTVAVTGFSEEGDFDFVDVRIRGRGNSTWYADWAPVKRPLRLRFDQQPRSMFGSEYAARDWILLSNHRDGSLLRNYAAFDFTRRMDTDMQYVPMAQNFHMYINGEYYGIYLLTDERDVNPGRMDLTFNEDPALSDFFLEFCIRLPYEGGTENDHYVMVNDRPYDIRFPGSGSQRRAQAEHLRDYLYQVSNAIQSRDFDLITSLIDIDTFVDFYIVAELFHNQSLHYSSTFMYITDKGEGRRLFMGPIWDFDADYGGPIRRSVMARNPITHSPLPPNYWYSNLLAVPQFSAAVTTRWNQLVADGVPQATVAQVRHVATTHRADFERNIQRFPTFERYTRNYERDARNFADWMENRISWLNLHFNGQSEIFTTLWASTWYNWLLFFFGFGFIWMWFC